MMSTLAKTVALRLATNRQLLTTLPAITLTANSTTLDAAEANAQTRIRDPKSNYQKGRWISFLRQ